MFKISSRKGLGITAVVALATTLFAGAPAAQASTLGLVPSYTGTNTVLTGGGFSLTATSDSRVTGGDQFQYWVTNNSAVSVDVTVFANTTDTQTIAAGESTYFDNSVIDNNDETEEVWVAAQPTTGWGEVNLSVKAWVDENPGSDNVINVGEAVTSAVAIKYIDGRETTATTKFEDAVDGDDSLKVDVTFANADINLAQIAGAIEGGANTNGFDVVKVAIKQDTADLTGGSYVASYDSTAKALVFTYDDISTPDDWDVTAGSYEARTYYYDYKAETLGVKDADDYIKWGSTAYAEVLANVIDSIDKAVGTKGANVNVDSSDDTVVRAGTTSVEYTSALYVADGSDDGTDLDAAPAGIKAEVTFDADFASYGSSFKVGDKTVSSTSGPVTVNLVTDSSGEIKFTITSATAEAGDSVDITVESQTKTSGAATTTWEDATYTVLAVPTSGYPDNTEVSVAVGGTANLQFKVVDQWHVGPTTAYQLAVTRNGSSRDTEASWGYTATVTNGLASVAIKDNGDGYGMDVVTAQLQKQKTGGLFDDVAGSAANTDVDLYYTSAALLAASKVTADADNDGSVTAIPLSDLSDYAPFDTRLGDDNWAAGPATASPREGVILTGTVTTATGAPVKYAPVTVSLAGAVFSTGDLDARTAFVSAKDSLTVLTDSTGGYLVWVFTDVPGDQTVAVKAGAASESVDLTFATSTPKTVTVSANGGVATAQSGRTIQVAATVKDSNGHAIPGVTVTFSSVGVGIYAASTAETNASGVATVSYAVGVADTGSVDFTAKAGDKTSAKATVTFVRAAGELSKSGSYVTAKWSYANGQKVIITVNGYRKYSKVMADDKAHQKKMHLKKGRHTVNLYVGGVLVDTIKFTVKK